MGQLITFEAKGSFTKTQNWLQNLRRQNVFSILSRYGQIGVEALQRATPVESGETSRSWYFTVEKKGFVYTLAWHNSHVEKGVPIAIILQYGHGTGTGGYVAGRDYINPAIKPIFDQIKAEVFKVVKSA